MRGLVQHAMAPAHHDELSRELEHEILDYLARHPGAADGREGIFQCWILRERFLRGREALDEALARLVAQGLLEELRVGDGGSIYRAPQGPAH